MMRDPVVSQRVIGECGRTCYTPARTLGVPRMDLKDIERRIGETLAARPDVAFAYLFGSRARGTARLESDVDVAIYLSAGEQTPRAWLEAMGSLAGALAPLEVDCVLLNTSPPGLRFSVVRDGRVLVDRDPIRRRTFEVATRREYWDWEPRRRLHDEALLRRLRDGTYATRPGDTRPLATR